MFHEHSSCSQHFLSTLLMSSLPSQSPNIEAFPLPQPEYEWFSSKPILRDLKSYKLSSTKFAFSDFREVPIVGVIKGPYAMVTNDKRNGDPSLFNRFSPIYFFGSLLMNKLVMHMPLMTKNVIIHDHFIFIIKYIRNMLLQLMKIYLENNNVKF